MKRILTISLTAVLLLAVIFTVSADRRRLLMAPPRSSSSATDVTADIWQTFEATTPDTNSLSGTDGTSIGYWTTNGSTSALYMSTGAERSLSHTINGVADTGHTNGICVALQTSANLNNFAYFKTGGSVTTASGAFWFKFSSIPVSISRFIMRAYGANDTEGVQLTYNGEIRLYSGGGNIPVSANTWYRITFKITQNSTCYLRVYDVSGTLVGSEQTSTAANYAMYTWYFPDYNSIADSGSAIFSYDDIALDWTDATYPLIP